MTAHVQLASHGDYGGHAIGTTPICEPSALSDTVGAVNLPHTHARVDSHASIGVGESLDSNDTTPILAPKAIFDAVFVSLLFHASLVDDVEDQRKRLENRHRSMTRDDEWGMALPDYHPAVQSAERYLEELRFLEKRTVKDLQLTFKELPDHVVQHVDDTRGLGVKSVARWLGTVGDPAWHPREERPRKLRELYAYCGLDVRNGQAPRNTRGQQSNWNNKARMRAFNMMEPCIKVGGPYRTIYDEAKAMYVERGDIESKAHINNRAKRIGMKAIVRDLWQLFGEAT